MQRNVKIGQIKRLCGCNKILAEARNLFPEIDIIDAVRLFRLVVILV